MKESKCIEGWNGLTIKTKDGGSTIEGFFGIDGTLLYIPMGKYVI